MYSGVPSTSCALVSLRSCCSSCSSATAATPRSMSLTVSSPISLRDTKMLLGFRSRWTTPVRVRVRDRRRKPAGRPARCRRWRAASAPPGCRRACVRRASRARRRARADAQTPASSTSTNPGWRTAVSACASRSRRRRVSFWSRCSPGEKLERDRAPREPVVRLEHEAHAAPRDEPLQLVAGIDCLPDERFGHFLTISYQPQAESSPASSPHEKCERVSAS